MDWVDELFVRRFDDLTDGLGARDDYERLKVAAGLRQMLLDESPLAHQANRPRRLKLRFRVNRTRDHSGLPVQPDVLFHAHGLDPTIFQDREGTRELKLEQFLAHPLVETPEGAISVADLIRYGANKAGGVHLDPARDDSDARLEAAFGRMAAFGVHALAIALQTVTRITLAALKPLRDAIVRLPASLPLFAHYRLDRHQSIRFEGQGQFLATTFSYDFASGFSWNGVIRLTGRTDRRDAVIYEIGCLPAEEPRLSLVLDSGGALVFAAELDNAPRLAATVPAFEKSPLARHFVFIAADLCVSENKVEIALYLNGRRAATERSQRTGGPISMTRHTIGADLGGGQSAAFEAREIILATRCPSAEERASLSNYLWMQWHD